MAKLSFELHKIQRQVERLTGDPRQAAGLRKKIEARLQQMAANAAPQILQNLLKSGRAGWVNDPGKNRAVLVERGTGCLILDAKGQVISKGKLLLSSKPAIDQSTFLQHLKHPDVENFVPHMYLDKYGNVTVGIGLLLSDADDAERLPFMERPSGKPADKRYVAIAFDRVKQSGLRNTKARGFRRFTSLFIKESDAEILALDKMNEFLGFLNPFYFPEFDTYPVLVKMGILDLAYNVGARGARDKYPAFVAALDRHNWKQAGVKQRRDREADRADIVQAWFNRAAQQEPFFISHTNCQKRLSAITK